MVAAPSASGARRAGWVTVGLWVASGFLVYRPWVRAPFDTNDYGEFLPLLSHEHSAADQFRALNQHFLLEGRSHSLAHAFTVLNWQLFGWDPVGWQLFRCGLMATALIAAYALYVKLGVHRTAAALAVALFAWASPAIYGWIEFNAEPVALILVIAALWVADGYQTAARWPLRAAFIGSAIAAIGLSKEVLISVAPVVVVLACCVDHDGRWRAPRFSPRTLAVVGLAAGAAMAVAARAALELATEPAGEYASGYGAEHVSVAHAVALIKEFWLPVSPHENWATHPVLFPANVLFLLLLLVGSWRLAATGDLRVRDLVLGIGLPTLGVLAYLPWRKFSPFYPIPYLVGTAFLSARALCSVIRWGPRGSRLGVTVWVLASMLALLTAQRRATFELAQREVGAAAAGIVGRVPRKQLVLVVAGLNRWGPTGSIGYKLREYARAFGDSEPAIVEDSDCEARGSTSSPHAEPAVVLVYVPPCGALPLPTSRIKRYFKYVELEGLRFATNSLMVDVLKR